MDQPAELLDLAQSDPKKALELGSALIDRLPGDDNAGRSMAFRALGVAARSGADMAESLRFGGQSVLEAELADDVSLRSEALLSLAGSLAFSGDNSNALKTLDEAAQHDDPIRRAEIEFQRGTILARIGEAAAALVCLSAALPVFEQEGDRSWIAMTLHNRAMVLMSMGELEHAEEDLRRALAIDMRDGRPFRVAGEEHGLGMIASLRGDIPRALAHFDESTKRLQDLMGKASESQVSRCEVLMSAGLFREAFRLAQDVIVDLRRMGLAEDEAEAMLAGAQAALLAGDLDSAVALAEECESMLTVQERPAWATVARLTCLQATYRSGNADRDLFEAARGVAEILDGSGNRSGALRAWLLSGSVALQLGYRDEARQDLMRVSRQANGPIEVVLQSRLATALVRTIGGDQRGADAAVRAGLNLLDKYQAALGATDIRIGVERHARLLGDLGLEMALRSGRPRRVFAWMERVRGRALIHRPVAPPADDELVSRLAELRQVATELRDPNQPQAPSLVRRQRRIQESIRNRARQTKGDRGLRLDRRYLAVLTASLGSRRLIEFATLNSAVWAVVIQNGGFSLREVGSEAVILRELETLRFAMRRLARGRGSSTAASETASRLGDLVLGSVRLAGEPTVIVPTPNLNAVPWWALPECQGQPFTISPSAELWFRAVETDPQGERVTLVAGPDLEMSDAEVTEIGGVHPNRVLISSKDSTVETVGSHLDGARLAHIASHAHFQFENPMFSSLRLADGDLNVYDIERLAQAPGVVVLSACDSGFTETHAGEELMGLSSALLSMGTKSIIASVGLVPDSVATKDLMVALHRGLAAGRSPSAALHRAQMEVGDTAEGYVAASSFICIGAG